MNLPIVQLPGQPSTDDGVAAPAPKPANDTKTFGPGDYIDIGCGHLMSWERYMSE